MTESHIRKVLIRAVQIGGKLVLKGFPKEVAVKRKHNLSNIVSAIDVAAEQCIVNLIRANFPRHTIIAEESGCVRGRSEYTWVVDPLDGTSNFISHLPWFGVQIGVLRNSLPVMAAIYLPMENILYFAERGQGTYRNSKRVNIASGKELDDVLCAFGFDGSSDEDEHWWKCEQLARVSRGVRNLRATNSLVDFCFTLDGHFGAFINLDTRIWDIVPISLMLPEAGGKLTDLRGRKIDFQLGASVCERNYRVVGAGKIIHAKLIKLLQDTNSCSNE